MSTFVDAIRTVQKSLLRLCSGYWRHIIVSAAVIMVIPTLIQAAIDAPKPVLEESALEQTALEQTTLEETVLKVSVPEGRFATIPPISEVPPNPESESGAHSEHTSALDVQVCAPDGIAIGGYDLVSYHQADAPLAGVQTIYAEHLGLTYQFANTQNRKAFLADPSKYLPSYRGWCSTNLSMGRLACPDYTNYKLEDGRLLFFERVGFTNGLDIWNSDPLLHRRQADQNFVLFSTQG